MAKEIGIKINFQSTGQEVVVKNLSELEVELQKLQQDLKNLEFGSDAFKKTAASIQTLKSKIEDVDKATEGLGVEKRFQAIGAAVGVAVGSFQALSGVVGLFTDDAEDLKKVQEAEAQALQVLNIALGVNSVALQLNEALKLKDVIATKAQTIATKAAAAAQRLWNFALASNPIGLFLTALATLTAAIIYYNSETKKSIKTLDEAKIKQDELNKINEDSIVIKDKELEKIVPLLALTEKENISRENRTKAIKAIQKDYPEYLKNVDLEKTTIEDIKKANDKLVESMEKVARSRAAMNELTQIYQDELQIQADLEQGAQAREERLQEIYRIGDAAQVEGQRKVNKGLEETANKNAEQRRKELQIRKQVALSFIDEADAIKLATGETKENTKETKKNIDATLKAYSERVKLLQDFIAALKDAQTAQLTYDAQIIQSQEKVIDEQQSYLTEKGDMLKTAGEKYVEDINNFLFKTIPGEEEAKKLTDGYASLFNEIDEAVRTGRLDFKKATGWGEFVKFAETNLPGIGKQLANVNEESRKSFVQYFNSLDERIVAIKKGISETPNLTSLLGIDAGVVDLEKLRTIEEEISKIRSTQTETGLTDIEVRENSLKTIQQVLIGEDKLNQLRVEYANNLFNIQNTTDETTKETLEARNAEIGKLQAGYKELAQTILDGAINSDTFITGLRNIEEQSKKNEATIKANKELIEAPISPERFEAIKDYFKGQADNFSSVLSDLFSRTSDYASKLGEDGIKALFMGLQEGLPEIEGQTRQELEKLSAYLQIVGNEIAEKLGLPENPFTKYINEATEQLKKLPTESEEAFTKMVENLNEIADVIVRVFQDISSRVQNILQQQTSLLLEQLQYQEEVALATIGEANTESAEENKKIAAEREKVQKESAKKRFEIEKQARVQELQFGLANAISSAAQAVIQALALPAPPPAPQLYAAAVGGLSAIQILQIREQLQFTQSKAYVGRKGGLVEGSSHEYGGVPALLEGGEFIVSKSAVAQYGDIISGLNASVGAKPLAIDDSRLVQAIASQNTSKTPIKTYVLYNDIQNTDKLNKKIENLSKL